MNDREEFLTWVYTSLAEAERAQFNGDDRPRRAIWSREEPVSVLGAWRNATNRDELVEAFEVLASSFSDCTGYSFDLIAFDMNGDMAYTVGYERISASMDGQPRTFTLRATQVYRREGGEWRVAHRHADAIP
ncbi:nuclear transport factor 2 family protein [Agromyces albus]|uniref:Nuclear transport factor 2 family protein n=1 Tax=Agromyces albus TaxID=205332 RepID=A0A4Q2L440_9MICO|nr:nuclear transport factor 2 family protein [Agromyces albus]RXZ72965.1 nuclear transport factor 2 family protein [Agromyces albus]